MSEKALDREPGTSLLRQVERLLALGGIIAALIYTFLRLAYAHFYYPFEVEPEEVGLGQVQILSQSFVGLILIFLGLLIIFAILIVILTLVLGAGGLLLGKLGTLLQPGTRLQALLGQWLARGPFKAGKRKDWESSESSGADGPEHMARKTTALDLKERSKRDTLLFLYRLGVICLVVLVFASFRVLFLEADRASRGVIEDGYTISAVFYRIGTYRVIALNVKASHSTVEWKVAANTPSALKRNPQCIVYLGKANGTSVVFDVKDSTTIRFPTNDAVITVYRATARLPASCYE